MSEVECAMNSTRESFRLSPLILIRDRGAPKFTIAGILTFLKNLFKMYTRKLSKVSLNLLLTFLYSNTRICTLITTILRGHMSGHIKDL